MLLSDQSLDLVKNKKSCQLSIMILKYFEIIGIVSKFIIKQPSC